MATILLADFFGDSGYLLRAILRGLGFRAVLARSLAAARRAINEQAVKALLIDLRTPTDAHLELLDHAMLTRDGQLPMLAVLARQQRFRCDPRLARFPRGHFAGVIRPPLAGSTLQAALDSALAAARPEADRRQAGRLPLDVEASLRIGQSVVPCRTLNLSAHGAALLPMLGESAQHILLAKIRDAAAEAGAEAEAEAAAAVLEVCFEWPGTPRTEPVVIPAAFVGARKLGRGAQQVWRIRFARQESRMAEWIPAQRAAA